MKIAITCGVFDMFHYGHKNLFNELLKFANKETDELVIFLHDDYSTYINKNKFPVQSFDVRRANLHSVFPKAIILGVNSADPSNIFNETLPYCISRSKDIIYIRGDDWRCFPGKNIIESFGIKIKYIPYTEGISSTKLREELNKK